MDIQATGINSYYVHQSALEQGTELIPSSSDSGYNAQDPKDLDALPLSDDEEQIDPDAPALEDEDQASESLDSNDESDAETELTQEEKQLVQELEQVDGEVRAHEMAHIAAGGEYITSGATFSYQKGPDGKNYAIGGEVGIDTSPEPGDPEATLQKMRQVRTAALAPAQPSSQDLKVASKAASQAAKAMAEITQLKAEEQAGQMDAAVSGYTRQQIVDAYEKTDSMDDQDTSNSLNIAV